MKKLNNTETELKKSAAYKKASIWLEVVLILIFSS